MSAHLLDKLLHSISGLCLTWTSRWHFSFTFSLWSSRYLLEFIFFTPPFVLWTVLVTVYVTLICAFYNFLSFFKMSNMCVCLGTIVCWALGQVYGVHHWVSHPTCILYYAKTHKHFTACTIHPTWNDTQWDWYDRVPRHCPPHVGRLSATPSLVSHRLLLPTQRRPHPKGTMTPLLMPGPHPCGRLLICHVYKW